ncbi:hypothetical protein M8J77_003334 [Diaphorina citri]|nr:hypothetical protein M8J77_003334 [Diaphorina citri]
MTEGSQEFCLRANQETMISLVNSLLKKETLVDLRSAEGQYLKAHKVVLCTCSPVFEMLLSQHNDERPILIFSETKFNELKSMIDYMYKGEVNIAPDERNHFLKAAERFQIRGLSESESTTQTAVHYPDDDEEDYSQAGTSQMDN